MCVSVCLCIMCCVSMYMCVAVIAISHFICCILRFHFLPLFVRIPCVIDSAPRVKLKCAASYRSLAV